MGYKRILGLKFTLLHVFTILLLLCSVGIKLGAHTYYIVFGGNVFKNELCGQKMTLKNGQEDCIYGGIK
jgi:hypothetical protein